ncbi:hypothetical protein PUN28_006617 [Cardiocondyla obscurior]|uniref:Uncharacterized protein n=1 Tax=Cardiocondyla obscurior TaxID=286306 RepID=A0AAW2GCB0_9HYME
MPFKERPVALRLPGSDIRRLYYPIRNNQADVATAADRTSVRVANIIVTRWPAVSLERNLIRASVRRSRKPEIREDEEEKEESPSERARKREETDLCSCAHAGTHIVGG